MATETTKCLDPAKSSGVAGQFSNARRAATNPGVVATGLLLLADGVLLLFIGAWPLAIAAFFAGVFFYLWFAGDKFFDWWLNERLLCLANDRCAIGTVWSVQTPQQKRDRASYLRFWEPDSLEAFDNDFSLDLLLSPAVPGDPASAFAAQAELVRRQAPIRAAGFATLGLATTAISLEACDPGGVVRRIAELEFTSDPEHLPSHAQGLDEWTSFANNQPPLPDSDAWHLSEEFHDVSLDQIVFPDTQMLHCEFEGDGIAQLQKWWPLILLGGLLAPPTLLALGAPILLGIPAIGPLAAALWMALAPLLAAFFIYVFARMVSDRSHDGNPGDAMDPDDPMGGDVKPISHGDFHACKRWEDIDYEVVAIRGRWVYDSGHTRGWNEIHPVRHIQFITNRDIDRERANTPLDAKHPKKGSLPPIRPSDDAAAQELLELFCGALDEAKKAETKVKQAEPRQQYSVHPLVG